MQRATRPVAVSHTAIVTACYNRQHLHLLTGQSLRSILGPQVGLSRHLARPKRAQQRGGEQRARCGSEGSVDESTLPEQWKDPSVAVQKAQELRSSLHQWLDDEFCPEPANVEISERCARVVEACLKQGQLDPGDILVEIVQDLETFSFKNSFHGPFSSANAAIRLLMEMGELA